MSNPELPLASSVICATCHFYKNEPSGIFCGNPQIPPGTGHEPLFYASLKCGTPRYFYKAAENARPGKS